MCFGKFGPFAFRWAMGRPSSIKIVRLAATWNFFGADTRNCKKRRFLLKTCLLDIFWWENFSRIGPCESSLPEVSENVVLLGRASFLTGVIAAQSQQTLKFRVRPQKKEVLKKKNCHNFEFSGLKRIAGVVHPMSYLGYSFQARKIKIVAVSFFCYASSDPIFFWNLTWLWQPITPL